MIVVNPDGTQHHYALEGDEMVALEPIHNPDYVAAVDPLETLAADVAYWAQSLSEIGNPPEMVMRQGERDPSAADCVVQLSMDLADGPEINQDFARSWDKVDTHLKQPQRRADTQ